LRVIEATERSVIEIPLNELLESDGKLKLRPDLIGKGLIEIQQASNTLKLRVNGIIGRIPVTKNLYLDVQPKFPVSNLNHIIYTSRSNLTNPFPIERPYETIRTNTFLPVPLILSFTKNLEKLIYDGIHREYIPVVKHESPRPKINFIKSHQTYWAKLKHTLSVTEQFDFSVDNKINQCIKLAALKSVAISHQYPQLKDCIPKLSEALKQMSLVSIGSSLDMIRGFDSYFRAIPSHRFDYKKCALNSIEIISNSDVSLNISKTGINLDSYVVSLDSVFENYIRTVISRFPDQGNGPIATVDGNLQRHQKALFRNNKKYRIKPDLIIKDKGGPIVIGDVKYKIRPQEEDRYQIITHSLSYGVKSAILIYPKPEEKRETSLIEIGRIGSEENEICIFEYYFDLSGDLVIEEEKLRDGVQSIIS
jgi:5-methylcytosine-specific restriction enzyme subunit McrC